MTAPGSADDPYNLARFQEAQAGTAEPALAELWRGRKTGHWMWFIFPQLEGLGASHMARRYALASLEEARAYLRHPVLGPRLIAFTQAANRHAGRSAREIFGSPDDLKFRSSMTLFAAAAPGEPLFVRALDIFFGGKADPLTIARLVPA
ncbi:MAG: DUF1810 domain-containing protein [Phenylobacterium sp.]